MHNSGSLQAGTVSQPESEEVSCKGLAILLVTILILMIFMTTFFAVLGFTITTMLLGELSLFFWIAAWAYVILSRIARLEKLITERNK